MKAWLIVVLVLFLLAWLPVGVELRYDGAVLVALRLGPVKIRLLPAKKKKPKATKPKKQKKESKKPKKEKSKDAETKPTIGGTIEAAKPLVRVAVDALRRFRHMLLFRDLTVHVTFGASNAADAAIGYGRAWAAIGCLTPMIDNVFHVRRRDYQAFVDYEKQELQVLLHAHLTIFLWQILSFAVVYGVRGIKAFVSFNRQRKQHTKKSKGSAGMKHRAAVPNKSKGGAKNESSDL
jgi:hypothetical protein